MTSLALPPGTAAQAVKAIFPPPVVWLPPPHTPPLLPHQTPPSPATWRTWILMGGRGSGKTAAGARYVARYCNEHPGTRGRIIGPTLGDVFESCIEGPSGLRQIDPTIQVIAKPGGSKVLWPNGSEMLLLGTPTPIEVERLRASGNRDLDWWEEAAANRQFKPAWQQARLGLRQGLRPHSIITTTPRNVEQLRILLADPLTVSTHGTINDNPHLDPVWKAEVIKDYAGTRLGRQELEGLLLTDVPGALWSSDMIEAALSSMPASGVTYKKVVVGVDPAVTSHAESDDTGIVVCARGEDDRGYVLSDRTCHETPNGWAKASVKAFDVYEANRIVGEVNNGGDLVETVIRTIRPNIPYKKVSASRGKAIRAEPISTLYEQGRISHTKSFPELEAEMVSWDPEDPTASSPNRVDALVWAFTELGFGTPVRHWRVR